MINKLRMLILLGLLTSGIVFLSGCVTQTENATPNPTSNVTIMPTSAVTLTSTPTLSPTPPPTVINITDPKEGDIVQASAIVSGIISGELPEGRYMWLVVNPQKAPGQWWPQGGQIAPLQGKWDIQATFGGMQDIGTKFKIAVILINKVDDQYYQDYFAKGKQTGNYPGIPLPASTKIMDSISVMRQ